MAAHFDCQMRGPHGRHTLGGGKPTEDKTCCGEPSPDQSHCDIGDHQHCSGYTEDESDPETCTCICHNEGN